MAETADQVKTGDEKQDLTGTVAKHYNELQEKGLETRTESRIFYLRNFNNWVKSILIGDTLQKLKDERPPHSNKPIVVLDLCSGKGGDLLKWRKGKIDKIVCADIASTSVEQCEMRYEEMINRGSRERYPLKIFDAQFITADCTKVRLKDLYKDPSVKFDIVSCQFSFHYCFESLPQAEMMLKNACECLQPGGYFIGTTPNSHELVTKVHKFENNLEAYSRNVLTIVRQPRRLRDSSDNSFGNEVYRVTFPQEDKESFPLFGAKYDFHLEGVVDCPEFLVYFPVLEEMAEKYGMKLIARKPFAEYFNDNYLQGEGRSLLGKMRALETFPADASTPLVSSIPDNYSHAENFLKDNTETSNDGRNSSKVGTLSKDEWEATTIYCAFIFKKIDPSENKKEQIEPKLVPDELKQAPKRKLDDEQDAAETKVAKVAE